MDEENKQEETLDWKAMSRKWEQRSKENRAEADIAKEEADALRKKAEEAEQKLKEAEEKAAKAESEAAALQAEKERNAILAKVADETGVPAAILRGSTEEELRAHAQAVQEAMQTKQRFHTGDTGAPQAAKPITRESIAAIEDDLERRRMMKAHPELYRRQ